MVQTRNQWNSWANRGFRNTQSTQNSECESCNNSIDYNPPDNDMHGTHNQYSDNDHCKRHRKPDNQEKTQRVVSYKRRTPL